MRKTNVSIAFVGLTLAMALAGCGGSSNDNSSSSSAASSPSGAGASSSGAVDGKGAKVGIILPDTTSSPRWVTADPEALKANSHKFNLD
jgi:D-xylose transport system substrate-binding protein